MGLGFCSWNFQGVLLYFGCGHDMDVYPVQVIALSKDGILVK